MPSRSLDSPAVAPRLRRLALAVLLSGALLETAVRFGAGSLFGVAPAPAFLTDDPELGWRLRAGVNTRHTTAAFDVPVRVNAAGFRGPEWPAPGVADGPDDAPPTRVLLLGDSFVFGWGVPWEHSLGARLAEALPACRVAAAGVPGYGTGQERLLLGRLADHAHWDHVVLVYSANDALESTRTRAYGRSKPRYRRSGAGALELVPARSARLPWLERSAAWRLGARLVDDWSARRDTVDLTERWELTRALVEALADDLDGGRLTIVSHEEALAQLALELPHVGHVHLDPWLRPLGAGAFLEGDPHWSAGGHAAVARAVAKQLSPR